MSFNVDQSIKKRWESIFRKGCGGDMPLGGVYTRLFTLLDPHEQGFLLSTVTLKDPELPVVGSVKGSENWLLLTTRRLVWFTRGERRELAVDAIRGARQSLSYVRSLGPDGKRNLAELRIFTSDRQELAIEVEPGPPLYAFWNVINNAGTRARRALTMQML
jgi:hypothetical protein